MKSNAEVPKKRSAVSMIGQSGCNWYFVRILFYK